MRRGEAPQRPDRPPRLAHPSVRASSRIAGLPEDVEMSADREETVTSEAVPDLTRQQALGPLLSRVVNDANLAVLSVILEQMDDWDVAPLRQTCRVLRDGVDACMMMKRMVVGEREQSLDQIDISLSLSLSLSLSRTSCGPRRIWRWPRHLRRTYL